MLCSQQDLVFLGGAAFCAVPIREPDRRVPKLGFASCASQFRPLFDVARSECQPPGLEVRGRLPGACCATDLVDDGDEQHRSLHISGLRAEARPNPGGVRGRWRGVRFCVEARADVMGHQREECRGRDALVPSPVGPAVVGKAWGEGTEGREGDAGRGRKAFSCFPGVVDIHENRLMEGSWMRGC